MKYSLFILFIYLLSAGGCQRKAAPLSDAEFVISISTVCGWCTGGDSLVINPTQSVYQYFPSCDTEQKSETTRVTERKQWSELTALLDEAQFKKININLCNVCADGCDVRVTLKSKNYNHSISYGSKDNEAVTAIRPFLEKLEAISAQYKKEHKK